MSVTDMVLLRTRAAQLMREAAAEIERLRVENARLREEIGMLMSCRVDRRNSTFPEAN